MLSRFFSRKVLLLTALLFEFVEFSFFLVSISTPWYAPDLTIVKNTGCEVQFLQHWYDVYVQCNSLECRNAKIDCPNGRIENYWGYCDTKLIAPSYDRPGCSAQKNIWRTSFAFILLCLIGSVVGMAILIIRTFMPTFQPKSMKWAHRAIGPIVLIFLIVGVYNFLGITNAISQDTGVCSGNGPCSGFGGIVELKVFNRAGLRRWGPAIGWIFAVIASIWVGLGMAFAWFWIPEDDFWIPAVGNEKKDEETTDAPKTTAA